MPKTEETTEETTTPITAEAARKRLKELQDEKTKANDEARKLREALDEGKEQRKEQRAAGAMLKKLFKDRRALILRNLPLCQTAAGANGSLEELTEAAEKLEAAQDDIIEVLQHQKAILNDENHIPDISNLELPEVPNKARTRTPATAPDESPKAKAKKKKAKKSKK